MQLTVRQKLGDARDVKLIRDAVPFMLKKLLAPSQLSQVSVQVSIVKLNEDCGDIELHTPPLFKLRLSHQLDSVLMLLTLAHELIHLSQVVEGRLNLKKINGLTVWFWDGRPYGSEPYDSPLGDALPWEIDANRRESDLACQFLNDYVRKLNVS